VEGVPAGGQVRQGQDVGGGRGLQRLGGGLAGAVGLVGQQGQDGGLLLVQGGPECLQAVAGVGQVGFALRGRGAALRRGLTGEQGGGVRVLVGLGGVVCAGDGVQSGGCQVEVGGQAVAQGQGLCVTRSTRRGAAG